MPMFRSSLVVVTTTVPAEEVTGVGETCDLHVEMDETIAGVKSDVAKCMN